MLLHKIKGIIFDIDGTLVEDGQAIEGVADTIESLRAKNLQMRFITNITSKTPHEINDMLGQAGIYAAIEEIETAVTACNHYIGSNLKAKKIYPAVPELTAGMLNAAIIDDTSPDYVVLGDLGDRFSYEILNKIFLFLQAGAGLIAFHRNPYFIRNGRNWLDSGMFTMGLEAASGRQAIIMGKPSPAIFQASLDSMRLTKSEAVVVGDDVNTDILGGKQMGLKTILVGTGKYRQGICGESKCLADYFIPTLEELPGLISV